MTTKLTATAFFCSLSILSLSLGCESPLRHASPSDALTELEAETGARWRANFDPTMATATYLARVGTAGARVVAPAATADPVAAARAFVGGHGALLGAASAGANAIVLRDVIPDALGGARARFELRLGGLPVDGGDVLAIVDADGTVRAVTGRVPRLLDPGAPLAIPQLTAAQATARALAWVAASAIDLELAAEGAPQLVAFVNTTTGAVSPAWRITVSGGGLEDPSRLARRTLLLDAVSGDVLRERDELLGERATGSGLGVDGTRRTLSVWRNASAGDYTLRDDTRTPAGIRTYTAQGRERLPGRLVRSTDPDAWDESYPAAGAAVDAHAFAGVVYDYLDKVHDRASIDGRDGGIRIVVHYGDAMENAFWDGRRAVFGDGSQGGGIGPLAASLDIVAHELFHGVTQADSGLVYEGESGALNESLSDVFATFVELRAGGVDWTIGEDAVYPPLRDLSDPARVDLPSHMSQYVDWPISPEYDMGGVHVNSSIPSHAAYLVARGGMNDVSGRSVTGIGASKTRRIWYRAAHLYLGPWASFRDFAFATLTAAEDLYGADSSAAHAVDDAWRAVGVTD